MRIVVKPQRRVRLVLPERIDDFEITEDRVKKLIKNARDGMALKAAVAGIGPNDAPIQALLTVIGRAEVSTE